MTRHNFPQAQTYLEKAYKNNPEHRGIQKNLGYTYTWLGHFHEADRILEKIPEAQTEMEEYAGWWQTQGREDLSQNAIKMVMLLGNEVNHP